MGTIALYRGLTVGSMGVVAPLSAVLAAALPAMIGIATGDSLSAVQVAGLALALPGVALISLQSPGPVDSGGAGVAEGLLAGVGFALLFIGLARAGTSAGAWPLVPCQAIAVVTVLALGLGLGQPAGTWAGARLPAVITGVLGGGANLLYLAATGKGQLSIVAVLTALYPAVTILLARGLLHEHWRRVQVVGLALSAVAIGLISVG
jgi:drug/metabolite transporter (DMT)-like permease